MASAYDPAFDRLVMAGPIVDSAVNPDVIGAYGLEYDGPRCAGDDCRTAVEDDGEMCDECATCPTCRGAGGFQQYDGLIVECPRGCWTGGAA